MEQRVGSRAVSKHVDVQISEWWVTTSCRERRALNGEQHELRRLLIVHDAISPALYCLQRLLGVFWMKLLLLEA